MCYEEAHYAVTSPYQRNVANESVCAAPGPAVVTRLKLVFVVSRACDGIQHSACLTRLRVRSALLQGFARSLDLYAGSRALGPWANWAGPGPITRAITS